MIPRTNAGWHTSNAETPATLHGPLSRPSWQKQLQEAIREPQVLLQRLGLDESLLSAANLASREFPLLVPEAFLARMTPGNLNDPLLKQVLPVNQELIAKSGYVTDPVGEQANPVAGLIRKYQGRALLMVNGHCAVNCRYCFRRHFPYADNKLSRTEWLRVLAGLEADKSINEVIFSGGDPLASSDRQLDWLLRQLEAIPHIRRLRIHSRLPVVIPDRISEECLSWLGNTRLQTLFVLHINHSNELDNALSSAISKIKQAGVVLLNQSVLLHGVNDTPETLAELSEALFANGVMPYYLHRLDKVAGAAHFDLPEAKVRAIYQALLAQLPGYLVPKLVTEIAGEASKTPLY